jgi:hypothetical protein
MAAASTYNVLEIPFQRNAMKDGADFHTGLSTLIKCKQAPMGINRLRLEMDIDATAVAPTIQLYANIRKNDACQARGLLRVERSTELVPAGAQEFLWQNKFNLDSLRPLLSRVMIAQADTEVTAFRINADGVDVINRTAKVNENQQTKAGLRTPQSGYVIYDTSEDGYSHPLRVGNVAQLNIYTTVAAGNYTMQVVRETIGSLGAA